MKGIREKLGIDKSSLNLSRVSPLKGNLFENNSIELREKIIPEVESQKSKENSLKKKKKE